MAPPKSIDPKLTLREFGRLHNKEFIRLGNAMIRHEKNLWRKTIENLPQVLNGKISLVKSKLDSIQRDPITVIDYMVTLDVKVAELASAFERLGADGGFDEGLYLLGKQMTDIKIVRPLSRNLGPIMNGASFELICEVDCFPRAQYEYFKDGVKKGDGPRFVKQSARFSDSGQYVCRIRQERFDGPAREEFLTCKVDVERDDDNERLKISVGPVVSLLLIGHPKAVLKAVVNEPDLSLVQFQWFKLNEVTNTVEVIDVAENATANRDELEILDFGVRHAGTYKCRATRQSTNEQVMSVDTAQLVTMLPSKYELKIALLIGTETYHKNSCRLCQSFFGDNFEDLFAVDTVARLKSKLEAMGYVVMAFLNLDSESYLNYVRLFRSVCETVQNASIFIYVAGHGYSVDNKDFFMPTNVRSMFHNNGHEQSLLSTSLSKCGLDYLLASFKTTERNKFTVTCFWDLCRVSLTNLRNIDAINQDNINFSIIFACNVGHSAYQFTRDIPELNVKRGSILLNYFLKHLRPHASFESIITNINEEIVNLRNISPLFKEVTGIRLHSTVPRIELSANASKNQQYAQSIDSFYPSITDQQPQAICINGTEQIGTFRFTATAFLNRLGIEVEFFELKIKAVPVSLIGGSLYFEDADENNNALWNARQIFRINSGLPVNALKSLIRNPEPCFKLVLAHTDTNDIFHQLLVQLPVNYLSRVLDMISVCS